MIYLQKEGVTEEQFANLLSITRENTLKEFENNVPNPEKMSPLEFEDMIFNVMSLSAKGTDFEGHIEQTGAHAFPDIIARKYFGGEVKMTTGNKWVSVGNSILESTRASDVERIYLIFGKFGGEIDIKYRPYQECLFDIGVTHSPRYKINMDLADGMSIFDKMGVEYDVLRKNDPIKQIKEYYRKLLKDGEELWWIDQDQDDGRSVSPIIKPFRSLSLDEQKRFITESMIFFPEMFGKSRIKFERSAAYLITEYNAVSSSLRDIFTAGGTVTMKVKGKRLTDVPKILKNLRDNAKQIAAMINDIDEETLANFWKIQKVGSGRISEWKRRLSNNSSWEKTGISAVNIFEEGLND